MALAGHGHNMLLYLILYEIFKNQKSIDKYIMKVSPNTLQVPSPHNNRPETIYTKLRNEITHRVDSSPGETRSGIIGNTHNLKCIAHTAIMAEIRIIGVRVKLNAEFTQE